MLCYPKNHMKYYFDTEFIENGATIDLISIGIAAEDGRLYHAQNKECKFKSASDWVWRNVFPRLKHFDMRGDRSCNEPSKMSQPLTGACNADCPWRYHWEIRNEVREFCDPSKFGKPEFWSYYGDYDWVAICQLFGTMMELPKGWPMLALDVKQFCVSLGDPELPKFNNATHSALDDAIEIKSRHEWLTAFQKNNCKLPEKQVDK